MDIKIKLIITFIVVIAIVGIINLVRKKRLELKYALIWFVVGICILVFTIFPSIMTSVAHFMGIYDPVNMLFFLGFIFSLAISMFLTLAISRMSLKIKNLAQELALYKKQTDDKLKEMNKDDKNHA